MSVGSYATADVTAAGGRGKEETTYHTSATEEEAYASLECLWLANLKVSLVGAPCISSVCAIRGTLCTTHRTRSLLFAYL